MKQVPDSLLAFQHMFPDDDACAAWLIEMRWPDDLDPLQRHLCPAAPEAARYRLFWLLAHKLI